MKSLGSDVEDLLRSLAPQVLGVLLRRHQAFDLCEDAVQEALLSAAMNWPAKGIPDNPRAWLITVATRRLIDEVRSEHSRREREDRLAFGAPPAELSRYPGDGASRIGMTRFPCCCCAAIRPSRRPRRSR